MSLDLFSTKFGEKSISDLIHRNFAILNNFTFFVLITQYPDLKGFIYGEENNTFTNALGESVTVILNETKSNTLELLTKILDGDEAAAEYLTECVHSMISIDDVPVQSLPNSTPVMALTELALWIDPIGIVRLILIYFFFRCDYID